MQNLGPKSYGTESISAVITLYFEQWQENATHDVVTITIVMWLWWVENLLHYATRKMSNLHKVAFCGIILGTGYLGITTSLKAELCALFHACKRPGMTDIEILFVNVCL